VDATVERLLGNAVNGTMLVKHVKNGSSIAIG
jgi:hypothetical protein